MSTPPPIQSEPLLVVILGPTGSGKSALAIALAQQFAGEVVSCDSVAIYRHFEVGTAKPTSQQRALAPHHLLDVAESDQPFTAGEYARQASLNSLRPSAAATIGNSTNDTTSAPIKSRVFHVTKAETFAKWAEHRMDPSALGK